MKKILLLAFLQVFLLFTAFANNEVVSAIRSNNNGPTTDPSLLGAQAPCTSVGFQVTYTIPSGYATVKKYDWYANGTLVLTVTDPSNYLAAIRVSSNNFSVYCIVTYVKSDGVTLSAGFQSTTFTVTVSGYYLNPIVMNGNVIVNCASPVTFTTSPATISAVPPAGTYTYSWQVPAGYTISGATNGNSIAATATTNVAGLVKATLQSSICPYTVSTQATITPITPAPVFASSNPLFVCSGTTSQNFSLNAACGASSYTYTLPSTAGCTFTANGLKSYTSTSPTVSVTFPQTQGYQVVLSAVANYPNGVSSTATTLQIGFGVPYLVASSYTSGGVTYSVAPSIYGTNDVCFSRPTTLTTAVMTFVNATTAVWTADYVPPGPILWSNSGNGNLALNFKASGATGDFILTATNTCGSFSQEYVFESVTCTGSLAKTSAILSPNPASAEVLIEDPDAKAENTTGEIKTQNSKARLTGNTRITIYDAAGSIKKVYSFAITPNYKVNVSDLAPGIYFVSIYKSSGTITKKLVIQR